MQERRTLISSTLEDDLLDVVFSKNDGSLLKIFKLENWPDTGWTPIGIVVVPTSHNRYGDGSCGVMSIRAMSLSYPNEGVATTSNTSSSLTMTFGTRGVGVYATCVWCGGVEETVYIPNLTDSSSLNTTSVEGTILWPYAGTTTLPGPGPSTEYESMMTHVHESTAHYFLDFNGIKNTFAYLKFGIDNNRGENYNPLSENDIEASYTTNHSLAIACCVRFSTIGTENFYNIYHTESNYNSYFGSVESPINNNGFWYLPGSGELCYLLPKKFEINKVINDLNTKYGIVGTPLNTSSRYWSSSNHGNNNQEIVNLDTGACGHYGKQNKIQVRAFMRLGSERIIVDQNSSDIALLTNYFGLETITKNPESSTFYVSIICNGDTLNTDMTINNQNDWITATQKETTLRISLTQNDTLSNRTGTITITYRGYTGTITIIQLGGIISLSYDSYNVEASSGHVSPILLLDGNPIINAEHITTSTDSDWVYKELYDRDNGNINIHYYSNTSLLEDRTSLISITYVGQTVTFTLTLDMDELWDEKLVISGFDVSDVKCQYCPASNASSWSKDTSLLYSKRTYNVDGVDNCKRFIETVNAGSIKVQYINDLKALISTIKIYKSKKVELIQPEYLNFFETILVNSIDNVSCSHLFYFFVDPSYSNWYINQSSFTFIPHFTTTNCHYTLYDEPVELITKYYPDYQIENLNWNEYLPEITFTGNNIGWCPVSETKTCTQTGYIAAPGYESGLNGSITFTLSDNCSRLLVYSTDFTL